MARRVFQFSVALTLVIAVGGYWTVLQSVAWVGMAIRYAQNTSISEALEKTFDGQHPCKLCLAVKEGKQAERKHHALKAGTKLDLLCLRAAALIPPGFPWTLVSFSDNFALPRPEPPAPPPPRFA